MNKNVAWPHEPYIWVPVKAEVAFIRGIRARMSVMGMPAQRQRVSTARDYVKKGVVSDAQERIVRRTNRRSKWSIYTFRSSFRYIDCNKFHLMVFGFVIRWFFGLIFAEIAVLFSAGVGFGQVSHDGFLMVGRFDKGTRVASMTGRSDFFIRLVVIF